MVRIESIDPGSPEADGGELLDDADDGKRIQPEGFSKESEIEKLRTSGSMTQSAHEISRVRNLSKLQMGRFELEPWYFSPYPVEYTEAENPLVFVCEYCLCFYGSARRFERHRHQVRWRRPSISKNDTFLSR